MKELTMDKSAHISRTQKSAFVLDASKFTRMVEVVHARYERLKLEAKTTFTVKFADSRVMEFTDYTEVLALDNRVRNRIHSLRISATNPKGEDGQDLMCQVDLSGVPENAVTLNVQANDSRAANEAFADLEEQLDRVRSRSWLANWETSPIYPLLIAFGIVAIIVALLALSDNSNPINAPKMDDLVVQANKASTLEEKVDVLFQIERLHLSQSFDATLHVSKLLTFRTIAVLIPLFICLACLVYMPVCYPRAVFAWGDYGEHYKILESRRNVLWWVVIGALVINIVAGFFVAAVHP